MRILYVTQIVPFPPHGGVLQRGFNILRELGRAHDVHLLAFHHPDELSTGNAVEESKIELGRFCRAIEYFELWPKRSVAHKALGMAIAAIHPLPFSVLAHRSSALSRRIADICTGDLRPELVHLDTIALAPFAAVCDAIPTVLAHHNVESLLMERRAEHEIGWARKRFVQAQAAKLRRFESRTCRRFSLNITVSQADALALEQYCPGVRTAVVPNGVDTEYFQPRAGHESPAVVFTGGMNMFANRDAVEWFLAAVWPKVKARVPEVQFFAIGQRPSSRVLGHAETDSGVHAPGHVADVRPWVERAAVYVVPMRVGGGTRLKVVDAMAQGKAIVSTSLGAEGLDVQDGVHLLVADDPDAFAKRIVSLLHSRADRQRLAIAARQLAESRYSWHKLGDKLAAAYQQVIREAVR